MNIIWHGQSCFQITSQRGKGDQVSIVIDPFDKSLGLKVPKLGADILLISHQHEDHNNAKAVTGNPFVIDNAGEYEVKDVFIQAIPAFHDDSMGKERGKIFLFTIETEDISICHLSDLGQKELNSEQLKKIGQVDILMIPVGGVYTINAKEAGKIVSELEPKIIIPMHYHLPALKYKLDKIDKFLEVMGNKTADPRAKLSIKKKDLLGETAEVVVLTP